MLSRELASPIEADFGVAPDPDAAARWCEHYAKRRYENFTVASWFLPRPLRPSMYTIYAFCRFTDDLGDEAAGDRLALLDEWQAETDRAFTGGARHPITVALGDVVRETLLEPDPFRRLIEAEPGFARWFGRAVPAEPGEDDGPYAAGLTALQVSSLMSRAPVTAPPGTPVAEIARTMRAAGVSSVLVTEGERLAGIVTVHDLAGKVLAEGLTGALPVEQAMTPAPITIDPEATGLDAMTDLPRTLRNRLAESFTVRPPVPLSQHRSEDGTVKFLFSIEDHPKMALNHLNENNIYIQDTIFLQTLHI